MLYIGSIASEFRVPKDVDMISTSYEFSIFRNIHFAEIKDLKFHKVHYSFIMKSKRFEIEICDEGTSGYEYQKIMNSFGIIDLNLIPKATHSILLSIKKGHINFPVNFQKNIEDYNKLLDICDYIDKYPSLTKLRYKETEERLFKLRTPSLMKSSKKFFEQSHDFFKSYFIHDHIHKVMSHLDRPLYEYMQNDSNSAMCDKNKWDSFSDEWKDWTVLEEAYVIALERKLIPQIFGGGKFYTSEQAISWSLMRICTTLCSGWFRQWACDNYVRIKSKINSDYLNKFLQAVDKNEILMTNNGLNYEKENKN